MRCRTVLIVVLGLVSFWPALAIQRSLANPPDAALEKGLVQAGENRPELEKALAAAPKEQQAGIAFLIANMPAKDSRSLKADFLLKNADLAYRARESTPWGKRVPIELFLNDVLPYASVTETREPWRQEMQNICLPLVKDCKTIAEAAKALNGALFAKVNVRYSTQRNRADQSPSESMKTGLASCTGLSILLVDACRSVAIPARVAGIPEWPNKPGNHTWVEIWDGDWHFTGACEQDPKGLDRGWFAGDAALAKKDSVRHSIYASSFKRTSTPFPLVWAPGETEVSAENVTERYTRGAKPTAAVTRLQIRVWEAGKKARRAVPVAVVDTADAAKVLRGTSSGESADTNDILTFEVARKKQFVVRIGDDGKREERIDTGDRANLVVEIELDKPPTKVDQPLSAAEHKRVFDAARDFFDAAPAERAALNYDADLDTLLRAREEAVRQAAWQAYSGSKQNAPLKEDFAKKRATYKDHQSAYTVKTVGKKPASGWPLFIAMHGGGNAPKALNDSQWAVMQNYYRDQDSVEGYVYVALRAPNDTWNGFYDDTMCQIILRLLRQFVLFGEVNPNKVFIMGYSHGGYGAFFLGPKLPDRFAAIHASAAAATDGTIAAISLRNTRFTFMIGENDTAYGRRERCERFAAEIAKLRQENPGEFPVEMEFKKGHGHTGLPDRDKIKDMYGHERNSMPKHLSWKPTDKLLRDFFWLSVDRPQPGQSIDVKVEGGKIVASTEKVDNLSLWLDQRLVQVGKPLEVTWNGQTTRPVPVPSLRVLCESIERRGDPDLAACCRIDLRSTASK